MIDLTQPPEEIGQQRGKHTTQYQEIENSGIEINADNEEKREEPYCEEVVDDSQLDGGRDRDSAENQIRGKESSIIKTSRGVASSSETAIDLSG